MCCYGNLENTKFSLKPLIFFDKIKLPDTLGLGKKVHGFWSESNFLKNLYVPYARHYNPQTGFQNTLGVHKLISWLSCTPTGVPWVSKNPHPITNKYVELMR